MRWGGGVEGEGERWLMGCMVVMLILMVILTGGERGGERG